MAPAEHRQPTHMHAHKRTQTEFYSPGANLDPCCAHVQISTGDKRQPRDVILLRGQPSHLHQAEGGMCQGLEKRLENCKVESREVCPGKHIPGV